MTTYGEVTEDHQAHFDDLIAGMLERACRAVEPLILARKWSQVTDYLAWVEGEVRALEVARRNPIHGYDTIHVLGLPIHLETRLVEAGYILIEDLLLITPEQLKALCESEFGRTAAGKLKKALKSRGIQWG